MKQHADRFTGANHEGGLRGLPPLHFKQDPEFHRKLKQRVQEYFASIGKPPTATAAMYFKTALVLGTFAASYALLVFHAEAAWQGVALSALLGLSAAAIGTNIQHDASHGAYSKHSWANKLGSLSLDLIGGSSYLWRWKHVRFHHTYVNIADYDTDIDLGCLARITPSQKRLWVHRWQQWYLWPLYSFLAVKWQFFDDFSALILGRVGKHVVPRPRGADLLLFMLGKGVFFSLAFVIPLMIRPPLQVIAFYLLTALVAGICLSLIFILPHTVEESIFPLPSKQTNTIDHSRDIHQIRVTADFSRKSSTFTWLVGGLNYHREHHLFPTICHVHTPALATIIDAECEKAGIPHAEHASYSIGMVSHFKFLKKMGRA